MRDDEPQGTGCRGCFGTLAATLLAGVILVVLLVAAWFVYTQHKDVTGTLRNLQGNVQTRPETQTQWTAAVENQPVSKGDGVSTGPASSVTIAFFETRTVDLSPNTQVGVIDAYATRRGTGGHVTLKNWGGQIHMRAVRMVDPTSQFTILTPVASMTTNDAAADVTVAADGTTTIAVEIGTLVVTSAAQQVSQTTRSVNGLARPAMAPPMQGQSVVLIAGQQIVIGPDGVMTVSELYMRTPDALTEAVYAAFGAPGTTFTLTVTERMVNDYVASTDTGIQGYGVSAPTLWFSSGSVVVGGELSNSGSGIPVSGPVTVVAVPTIDQEGAIKLQVTAANVGGVPLPPNLVDEGIQIAESTLQSLLTDPETPVRFTSVTIQEESMTLQGTKGA